MQKRIVIIVVVVAAVFAGLAYSEGWFAHDSSLQGSGTVEARRCGRVESGRADRQSARARGRYGEGRAGADHVRRQGIAGGTGSVEGGGGKSSTRIPAGGIAEAKAALDEAEAEYEQRKNGYRSEDISAAQADLDRAKADAARAKLDNDRYQALADKDLVSKQQRDSAEAAWRMADAQQANAQHKLDELRHGYRPEEIAAAQARYEEAEATYAKFARGDRREDVELAKASFSYDEARFREREVVAPSNATVEVLDVRPGDLIAPNTPVATLLERDQIYIRIYIPETEIGHVTLGQKAEVRVDSFSKTVSTRC